MRPDAWVNIYVITKYIYLIVDKTSVSPEMTSSFFIQSFEAIMEANNVGRRDWKREITLIMKMFHSSPAGSWLSKRVQVHHKQNELTI